MRFPTFAALLLSSALAAAAAGQQALVCPAPSSVTSKSCELFHYHLQAYRPDTRQFAELIAVNQFASQSSCERAREAQIKRNLAVVDYFKRVRNQQQYEPDRFGPCHCDMTVEKSSAVFMTDAQRLMQVRTAEDVRLRVRERLLDQELTSDNALIRDLIPPPVTLPQIGGPKLVALPAAAATPTITNSADDLKTTRAVDARGPVVATLDLPLVEPAGGVTPAAVVASPPSPSAMPAATTPAAPAPASTSQPAVPSEPQNAAAAPATTDTADAGSAADAADSFIEYETQRIQNVLKASAAITDETVKAKIFESCMQRIQLLSNLRTLIEGSGSRSRLAAAAQAARSESDRLDFVTRLFGGSIAAIWAPKDAADVILKPNADVDTEPERVLRDKSGRFSTQQKKRALYVLLARSQPTEEQQLSLVTVADGFLR